MTAADHASEAMILEGLRRLTPDVPIVAEEQMAGGETHDLQAGAPFWCVDPLDGTRDFADGFDDYVVCIGLIDQGFPILGVLFAPATNTAWTGALGQAFRISAAGRERISARPAQPDALQAFISRSNRDGAKLDDYLSEVGALERKVVGSALKFALISEGQGDLYARFGRTHEWDTAAGQAVLEAAGGSVLTESGERLAYGKPGFTNGPFFARGKT